MMTRKTHRAAVKQAAGRTRRFTITTGSVDRDHDTIDPQGWDFTAFARNPVILAFHDYGSMPVARGSNWQVIGNRVDMDFTFASTPEGDACLALIDDGMLSACSVGFRPLEQSYDSARGGTNFLRQELLEVSIVPVPANAEALVQRATTLGLSASVVRKMFGGADDDVVLRLAPDDDVIPMTAETLAGIRDGIRAGLSAGIRDTRRHFDPLHDPAAARVNAAQAKAAIRDAVRQAFGALVREQTQAALARARGRVD